MKRNFLIINLLAVMGIAAAIASCRNAAPAQNDAAPAQNDDAPCQLDYNPADPQLELLHPKSIYMLGKNDCEVSSKQFDLSGFGTYKGKKICIADKLWTTDIYYFDTTSNGEFLLSICAKGLDSTSSKCDIEAVDTYNDRLVISAEIENQIFIQNDKGEFELLPADFTKVESDLSKWGASNAGIEGFAVDSQNNTIYFAKERDPRRLFSYDITKNEFHTDFDDVIKGDDGNISDMQYLDGYLYILDRANCLVVRLDVNTKEKTQYSFRKYSNNGKEHIYTAKFGMAEALLVTDDAIFIGFDNNNAPVSKYGEEIGLKPGSRLPSIFVFKRPQGF